MLHGWYGILMWLDVVFTPTELPAALAARPGALCAVIDVVRATTTLVVIGERGGERVLITPDVASARMLAPRYPGAQLTGEIQGLPPSDFDFGNSPAMLGGLDLHDQTFLFATTNGTQTILACYTHGAGHVIAAALRNAEAVAGYALQQPDDVAFLLVCAGRMDRVALDDVYAAGVIVQAIQSLAGSHSVILSEGAHLAAQIAQTAGAPLDVLQHSEAGRSVIEVGLADDLAWCADVSVCAIIPHVYAADLHTDGLPWVDFRD